jgi:hypothetical protein
VFYTSVIEYERAVNIFQHHDVTLWHLFPAILKHSPNEDGTACVRGRRLKPFILVHQTPNLLSQMIKKGTDTFTTMQVLEGLNLVNQAIAKAGVTPPLSVCLLRILLPSALPCFGRRYCIVTFMLLPWGLKQPFMKCATSFHSCCCSLRCAFCSGWVVERERIQILCTHPCLAPQSASLKSHSKRLPNAQLFF